jgi:pyruvate/2-oxoglutarate dehydrogenase complex dihydrolipoamide dehydrogenase (E3) component
MLQRSDTALRLLEPDLCVIGAGSGGLSVAAGAVQMGASVVLVEGGRMGGDCLNYGCVPSKSLIAAAAHAHAMRSGGPFGVAPVEPEIDYARAMEHVRETIAAIAPHDSAERFEGLGVTVIRAWARFVSEREIEADGARIRARRVVIATGSSPAVPPVPGLDEVPYLTNETLWDLRARPEHLLILGGGPIGMEMAQAHVRLGSRVTVVEAGRALGAADREAAGIALARLRAEGVEIREGATVERVSGGSGAVTLALSDGGRVTGSHLLVAAGRRPNLERLDLGTGGVAHDRQGVTVDRGLRSTTNRRVYAVGDAAGGLQFTHLANYHAGLVVRSALFRLPVRARTDHVPKVTYTDPEIAQIGLTEEEARAGHGDRVEVHRAPLAENDRARATRETDGLVKLVADRRGRILGVAIAAPHAGDLVQPWALALSKGLKVRDMTGHVAAYPTLGEASKRAAGAFYATRLFESRWVRRAVRLLARLG